MTQPSSPTFPPHRLTFCLPTPAVESGLMMRIARQAFLLSDERISGRFVTLRGRMGQKDQTNVVPSHLWESLC